MIRRLPVVLALAILLVAVPWKTVRLLPRLLYKSAVRSELFDRPIQRERFLQLRQILQEARRLGDSLLATQVSERLTTEFPSEPEAFFESACTAAAAGNTERALDLLHQAANLGFNKLEQLQSAREFQLLIDQPVYKQAELIVRESAAAAPVTKIAPAVIVEHKALITERNTHWDPDRLLLISHFQPPAAPETPADCNLLNTAAGKLVNTWVRDGSAAGLSGILYDNRDRGHSTMDPAAWPGLDFVRYSPEVRAAEADFGFRPWQRFNLPAFGNASTALVHPVFWRSNPRSMLTQPHHALLFLDHYAHNHLYFAPEHNDFDPEHGDVYPANAPCWVISQGSSGSDQPFLQAAALTLAAFPPDTRRKLESAGQLMHAVQWVLRQSQRCVKSPEDYFTGLAHPAVFRESQLDPERMVQLAHSMTIDRIPAQVQIRLVSEQSAQHGVDYFSGGPSEVLLDHPLLMARIHRTLQRKRKIVLAAASNLPPQATPVRFRWEVLQGDAALVEIRPLDEQASVVEITTAWNAPHPVRSAPEIVSSRIDIGVFTEHDGIPSMPAIYCSSTIASELRIYEGDRLVSVDYAASDKVGTYADPLLTPIRGWKDTYQYKTSGERIGWNRTQPGKASVQFNADGFMLPGPQAAFAPVPVIYEIQQSPNESPRLTWKPASL